MKLAISSMLGAAIALSLSAPMADAQSMLDPSDVANVLPGNDGFRLYRAGWHVMIDIARGTCLIERSGIDNNVVQMGLTRDGNFGYIGLFSQNTAALSDGEMRPVAIQLGDDSYAGTVVGVEGRLRGGFGGGYVVTQDVGFFEAIAQEFEMVISVAGLDPITVNLSGTLRAIEDARACLQEQSG
jgi:hypothetical protein